MANPNRMKVMFGDTGHRGPVALSHQDARAVLDLRRPPSKGPTPDAKSRCTA
jgi:hypothetical protein